MKKKVYESPDVTIMEIEVEKGFSTSSINTNNIDDFEEVYETW